MFSTNRIRILILVFLAVATVMGCGNTSEESTPAETAQLPSDHPPINPSAGQGATVPPPLAGSGTGASELTWSVPEGWVEETPSSGMRRAQYRVPGEGGDGECVVFYFGPGQGGDALANAKRWAGQFEQPDGRSSIDAMKTRMLNINGISVMLAEVTGTYNAGAMMGGQAESKPGYMLLGAIVEGPDANWFFKFTGPEATVRANQNAFESMLQSLTIGR